MLDLDTIISSKKGSVSMAYSNKDKGTAMLDELAKIDSMYRDKYLTLGSSQGIYTGQKQKLQNSLDAIQKQIDLKGDTIATYNREYIDRKTAETPFTFWRLRGISTLQDWVLLIFFSMYGIICLTILAATLTLNSPIYYFGLTLLGSIMIGIMMVATIARFA